LSDPTKTPVRGGLTTALLPKPLAGWSHNCLLRETPVRGGLTIAEPETGTGDRDRPVTGFWYFLKIRSVTMADSEPDEDGSAEVSCQDQQNSEGDDDVQ
jgi:hypothetical protein